MIKAERKEQEAYLYKVVDGKLVVRPGIVRPIGEDGALFYVKKENGKEKTRYRVSATVGEVYNNAVWFSEPDEEAAAKAFIRWADARMDEHVAKLKKLGEYVYELQSYIKPY